VAGSAAVQYAWPVPAPVRVVAAFVVPAGPYAPGHRGVDLATGVGGAVLAAADGWVRFAGPVAGRGVVVLAHADGLVTEYEPLRPTVQAGERVRRGQVIGVVAGRHRTCPPGRCVHWAARRADTYVDPARLLAPLAPPRLLPWPRR
jgi:murein DD-endopeptidase MepM/ murein hydrolase activator NlpD